MNHSFHNPKYESQVLARQAQIIYKQLQPIPVIGAIACSLILALIWGEVDGAFALAWLALAMFTYWVITPLVIYLNHRLTPSEQYGLRSRVWAIIRSVFEGSAWGLAAILLFDESSFYYQTILLAFVIGTAAIGALLNAAYRPTFFILTFLILTPFVVRYASYGDSLNITIALCIAFYMVLLVYHTNINYSSIRNSLYLQFMLNEQKEVAEEAKNTQTKFFAAASHDLRQPLHAYGLLADSLRELIVDPKALAIFSSMNNSMQGMRGLLNSILDISKLEAGEMKPVHHSFNLQSLFDNLFLEYESHASAGGVVLSVRSMDVVVWSDRSFIERILRNLLSNAIAHSNGGAVLMAARYHPDGVKIEIRDSGRGIPKEFHKIIFQEYKQVSMDDKTVNSGLGLGLAIVDRLCRLLAIDLAFESAQNKGAVFSFVLKKALTVENLPDKFVTTKVEFECHGKRVLVVDDDPDILAAMRLTLEKWQCSVTLCASGQEAIYQITKKDERPDLIIADYRLQEENGIAVVDRINKLLVKPVPAIIVTGDTSAKKIKEIQNSKHVVLYKPVTPDKLREVIAGLLPG